MTVGVAYLVPGFGRPIIVSSEGKVVGGMPFTYGPLAYLLKNRTYLGEIGHHGRSFPGEHEPIIDRDTFDKVQQLIKSHSVRCSGRPALLKGRKSQVGSVLRIPAMDIEATVLRALRQQLADSAETIPPAPAEVVERKVARIVLHPNQAIITLKSTENSWKPIEVPWSPRQPRALARIDESGASNGQRPPNSRLVQAIVRAHVWLKLLRDGTYHTVESLARAVGLHPKIIRKGVRLAFLSPTITKSILCGDQRAALMLGDLDDAIALSWDKQQRQLGPIPK
jgi:hypothetical protein